MNNKELKNDQYPRNKTWKRNFPLRTLSKVRTSPNTTSDDDYRTRIKPCYESSSWRYHADHLKKWFCLNSNSLYYFPMRWNIIGDKRYDVTAFFHCVTLRKTGNQWCNTTGGSPEEMSHSIAIVLRFYCFTKSKCV